jgi:hypothetical protein
VHGHRADGVASECQDRRGLGALAAHVSDHDSPGGGTGEVRRLGGALATLTDVSKTS